MIKKNSNKINKIIEVKNGKEDFWDSWFVFFLISALLYALYAEGVPYKVIGRFLSLPSLVIVAAFSG